MAVAALVRDLLGRERPLARIGAGAVTAGSLLWIAGNLGQLGGHRAVALMAAHGNPIDAVNSIAFTVDIIDQAFELAAFALAGAGLLAFARLALRPGGELRRWGGCTAALALLLLALAWSYAGGSDRLNNLLLAAGGILLPLWLIWTGRLLDPGT